MAVSGMLLKSGGRGMSLGVRSLLFVNTVAVSRKLD